MTENVPRAWHVSTTIARFLCFICPEMAFFTFDQSQVSQLTNFAQKFKLGPMHWNLRTKYKLRGL